MVSSNQTQKVGIAVKNHNHLINEAVPSLFIRADKFFSKQIFNQVMIKLYCHVFTISFGIHKYDNYP